MLNSRFTGLSPKQQIVFATCCLLYSVYLCGAGWRATHQTRIAFPVADPLPADIGYIIEPPVDVNTAGHEELQLLPGIGPVLAERILDYRKRYGPLSSVDELQRIRGIGPKTIQKFSYYLEFED